MGRWKRGKKRQTGKDGPKRPKLEGNTGTWTKYKKENKSFELYYKCQEIVPESEWEDFVACLKKDLPSTFRITGSKGDAQDLGNRFKDLVKKMLCDEDTEVRSSAPCPIQWYPDQLAWETKAAKRTLRKSPLFEDFHNFLVEETNCGAISRQEAVSMIPPLLLDVKSHHNVLDMCAAPGSKTTQLIEMMQDGAKNGMPSGLLIANDADNKRCYMLVHQSKRLTTPGCIFSNHDARMFPSLRALDQQTGKSVPLKFDRILCDVPCSGDGTLRKNPLLWNKWKPGLGYPLHRMQLAILKRGLELLKIGGRLVYSTCSMNPIEDEAVVAAMMKECGGTVKLMDMSKELPGLKRKEGLYTWKVCSKSGKAHSLYEEVVHSPVEYYRETMFCPPLKEAKEMNLERCIRILPHLQDTGGFFVAVFEKLDTLPWQSTRKGEKTKELEGEAGDLEGDVIADVNEDALEELKAEEESIDSIEVEEGETRDSNNIEDEKDPDKKETEEKQDMKTEDSAEPEGANRKDSAESGLEKHSGYKEDPYIFLESTDEDVVKIRAHYRMSDSFPSNLLLVRTSDGKKRNIYIVTEMVKTVVEMNPNKLKIINTGVKAFSRLGLKVSQEIGCDFRLTQEGLHVMRNFINAKVVRISRLDLQLLLTEEEPFIHKLSGRSQELVGNCASGCIVWHYLPESGVTESIGTEDEQYANVTSALWLCGHKGKTSVRCMLAKQERLHYARIVGIPKRPVEERKSQTDSSPVTVEEVTSEQSTDQKVSSLHLDVDKPES